MIEFVPALNSPEEAGQKLWGSVVKSLHSSRSRTGFMALMERSLSFEKGC